MPMKSAEEWKDIWKAGDHNIWELVEAIQADAARAQREAIANALDVDSNGYNTGYEDEYRIVTQIREAPLVSDKVNP